MFPTPVLPLPLSPLQHDAQLDYYGKRVATCSSDRIVKVFDVFGTDGTPVLSAELSLYVSMGNGALLQRETLLSARVSLLYVGANDVIAVAGREVLCD